MTAIEVPDRFPHVHSWVAGMMYVHAEDLEFVADSRRGPEGIECEGCEITYREYRDSGNWNGGAR